MLKFNQHKKLTKENLFATMNIVSQKANFRQSVVLYSFRNSIFATIRRFGVSRATIYRWRKRYNGTAQSLVEYSRRPHSHPNQHTPEELKLISDMRRRNPNDGLVFFWTKLMQRGYKRSIPALWRILRKLSLQPVKPPNPKYIPKPYEPMFYPGQRVQVDVKIVPKSCIVPDADGLQERYYQYTAIDEYSRFRFVMAFKEQSTYSSVQFVNAMIKAFPFKIECIQTDNGLEFIKSFDERKKGKVSLFEAHLKELGIRHKLIRPFTPRHNGKVERSHRKDNEYFYATHKFYSFEDFKKQLSVHLRWYNSFPMRPLHWKSPKQYILDYLHNGLLHN